MMKDFKYTWEDVDDEIIEENDEEPKSNFSEFSKFFSDSNINWNRIKKYDQNMLQR